MEEDKSVLACFQMISFAGDARSKFILAVHKAREGHLEEARQMVAEGKKQFIAAHQFHAQFLSSEANEEETPFSVLLLHAEDQLMSAETMEIMAKELIDICQELAELKEKLS